jgi:hypothetical protein
LGEKGRRNAPMGWGGSIVLFEGRECHFILHGINSWADGDNKVYKGRVVL